MRHAALFLSLALCATAAELGSSSWATVPASRAAHRLEVIEVPAEAPDQVVTLVGATKAQEAGATALVRSIALDLPDNPGARAHETPQSAAGAIPPDAIWPGPDGRISVPTDTGLGSSRSDGIRNPWEVRIRPRKELTESVFINGGVIEGGESPVALLNGRVVQQGSTSDGFDVALVNASGAVVRKNGLSYVIPLGRRVTIQTAQR